MEKVFYVRMKHTVNGVMYQVPVLAGTLGQALDKARDYPYNTFGDYTVIDAVVPKTAEEITYG
jgi:hypothetical protein